MDTIDFKDFYNNEVNIYNCYELDEDKYYVVNCYDSDENIPLAIPIKNE